MAEIDTSSYPRPTAGPSALDTIGKLQGLKQQEQQIQSGAIAIDKQKLDLVNQGIQYLVREVNAIDPTTATPEDFFRIGQNAVNQKFLTPEAYSQFVKTIPSNKADIPKFKNEYLQRAMTVGEMINWHYGNQGTIGTGQTIQPVATSPKPGFGGVRSTGMPIQMQVPPTAQGVNENNQPTFVGPQTPQLAPNTVAAPPPVGIPVAPPTFNKNFPGGDPLVGSRNPAQNIADRFPNIPRGMPVQSPPGVAEAEMAAGTGSGAQLVEDRRRAANFQREIFPLAQAIPALEKLGPKGTGPGTETLNHLKSFAISNVPGVKESDFTGTVKDYDIAKKYLTDFVNQTGNSGTNDKLAAAFAGNPSVGISNAAAVDVAKSALALRRMQQAQILEFEQKGMPASQYSKWAAKRINEYDPRAFGVDLMSQEAKLKLRKQLDRNPKEKERFERSLKLAESMDFFNPVK